MASSSADCVLGGVRLISSASTMLAKIGPGHEDQVPPPGLRVLLDDVGARDVGRHQVRRELDARELEVQHLGQGVHDQGLGQPGDAGDDAVAAHEERDQHLLDHVVLPDDELAQLAHDPVAALVHALGQGDVVRAG